MFGERSIHQNISIAPYVASESKAHVMWTCFQHEVHL